MSDVSLYLGIISCVENVRNKIFKRHHRTMSVVLIKFSQNKEKAIWFSDLFMFSFSNVVAIDQTEILIRIRHNKLNRGFS